MTTPIPGPRALPLIGNMLDMQAEVPVDGFEQLCDTYGPIYKLSLDGIERYFVGDFALFDEMCDETRFFKIPPLSLTQNARPGPRGLFTQNSEKDPDWLQAHRILMPAFGPMAVENMLEEMYDIATQMVMKWARMGPERRIVLTDDFTRLTLDTIALCSMDYRFNSFYSEELHPYVQAMGNTLGARSQAAQIGQRLRLMLQPQFAAKIKADDEYMIQVGRDLVQHRRENPTDRHDLLNSMIHGRDPKTGLTMRDDLIAVNMQTFLIAGHETTSGLLSFAFVQMLLNPETFAAAQAEVDHVVGDGRIERKHLKQLPYIEAVLRETLRLSPTAPAVTRGVRPENKEQPVTIGGGKYEIPRDTNVICLLRRIQKDPAVFGDDADAFRPERMLEENFQKLPKNAWKPFGTGLRACIGRAFAWQEAVLVTAIVLQNFEITLEDPNYKIDLVQTLTIKPKNTFVRVRLRNNMNATQLMAKLTAGITAPLDGHLAQANGLHADHAAASTGPKLAVLYGSNTGTCQALAQTLALEAAAHGYEASVTDLDSAIDKIPTDCPVVVITASYEGQPPDNAARFVSWLEEVCAERASDEKTKHAPFANVRFAVFGCGHKDWPATFHRIPTLVDALLAQNGASRLADRGMTDVAAGDVTGDFSRWTSTNLWPALPSAHDAAASDATCIHVPSLKVALAADQRAEHLQQKMVRATVKETRRLTADGEPEKYHLKFALPPGVSYQAGDYLAVLPLNPEDDVRRAMRRFALPRDAVVTIGKSGLTSTLPTDTPLAVAELLRGYVELALPVTQKDLAILGEVASDAADKASLAALAESEAYARRVLGCRTSLLDLLEQHPNVDLPLASFLALLPPLRVRQYSIASSPLGPGGPSTCSVCCSVIEGPAQSEAAAAARSKPRLFHGVASTYLRSLSAGDQVLVAVRPTNNRYFRLPDDLQALPLVLCCAGSGIAPFVGFLQERAACVARGDVTIEELAPALLFVGCRDPAADRLYADQIDAWTAAGIVSVRYAFSRRPDDAHAAGCARVPDRLRHDAEDVARLWAAGARFYVCGSEGVAAGLRTAVGEVLGSCDGAAVEGEEAADAWLRAQPDDRYVADVFS